VKGGRKSQFRLKMQVANPGLPVPLGYTVPQPSYGVLPSQQTVAAPRSTLKMVAIALILAIVIVSVIVGIHFYNAHKTAASSSSSNAPNATQAATANAVQLSACTTDTDCTKSSVASGGGPHCGPAKQCVECVADADCAGGGIQSCVQNKCVTQGAIKLGWTTLPGAATRIAYGSKTLLVATNAAAEISKMTDGKTWQKLDGGAIFPACSSDGQIWVINGNNDVFYRDTNGWTKFNNFSAKNADVASKMFGAAVNASKYVFKWTGTPAGQGQFSALPDTATQVSTASDGTTWIITPDGKIKALLNDKWQDVTMIPGGLSPSVIAVGSGNHAFALDSQNGLWEWNGTSWNMRNVPDGSKPLQWISAGTDGIAAVAQDSKLYVAYFEGTRAASP
jgi:hypothetical protein